MRNVIGDRGLQVVGDTCKKLRRLQIEWGDNNPGLQEKQGGVSQLGLKAVDVDCRDLEYIASYVSDITSGALESIRILCQNLYDFRFVLLDRQKQVTKLPLDNGVRALLRNCTKLQRCALYTWDLKGFQTRALTTSGRTVEISNICYCATSGILTSGWSTLQ